MLKEYSVYRGDDFLFIDTIKNIAKRINMPESQVRYRASEHYRKRVENQKNAPTGYILVRLD